MWPGLPGTPNLDRRVWIPNAWGAASVRADLADARARVWFLPRTWFDLTGAERPVLSFWTRWSKANGSHYSVGLHALDRPTRTVTLANGWDNERHNGVLSRVLIPLDDFVGSEGFSFSFSLETSGGPGDGVWIDDVLLELRTGARDLRYAVGVDVTPEFKRAVAQADRRRGVQACLTDPPARPPDGAAGVLPDQAAD